ncbi:Oidioi.mRNA.OKI2018_I69.XSR.g15126.t2.cds [Oikopleura dioica]|uniref:Oidioi.mRNA.OKI2018_I69.XSR.g15126.t2.cds n=1 Tax=Oikopleura dioica TaxID=34765 RepID=A0ABN7SBV9_OIKDI|nr:Oidioi.mRNA.OKI2018_I69.XSR.g15126.t2.cds [Oikopleura dioica]
MSALYKWLGRATMSRKSRKAISVSSTKVYFDIAVDEIPAGRIVFKIFDDLGEWTAPYCDNFLKLVSEGKFIGSEFQRAGLGRGEAVAFSTIGKSDVDLFELRKLWEFMLRAHPYLEQNTDNPLVHNREGLLTAVTRIPERYLRKEDFMRQLISGRNPHAETMFGITYDAHADMDGKFQVIGEIEEGWDSLIEIECACVQPVAYYYPNNQHLMALAEQTGADKDPLLLERIALGLQSDTYIPGMIDRQLALDAAEETTHSEADDENKTNYSEKINSEEKSLRSNEQRKEEILKGVPVALRPTFESSETALEKEKEKWLAWEKKSELDIVTMNKRQNFLNMEKKDYLCSNMVESGSDSARESEFGVKVSIQALKGHPFVILEGSDAKKKFVPAPKKADFDSNLSDDEQLIARNDANEFMPQSASHTLDREWEYQQSVSKQPQNYARPDSYRSNPTRMSDNQRLNVSSYQSAPTRSNPYGNAKSKSNAENSPIHSRGSSRHGSLTPRNERLINSNQGRYFALHASSLERPPSTKPRTISQDSDVQASLRSATGFTDDETTSIRSISSIQRRERRAPSHRVIQETDNFTDGGLDSMGSIRLEDSQHISRGRVYREERNSQDSATDANINRFESVDSAQSFPAPPASNGSSDHSIHYLSESSNDYQHKLAAEASYETQTDDYSAHQPLKSLSSRQLVNALKESSPLQNRPMQDLPPRFIPAPLPAVNETEKELKHLQSKFEDMQDEAAHGKSEMERVRALLERKEKELAALRKVLRDELVTHDQEITKLRNINRHSIENLKLEKESLNSKLLEKEAELESEGYDEDMREKVFVDNLKMTKEISQLRQLINEAKATEEALSRQLDEQSAESERLNKQLMMATDDDLFIAEIEVLRKTKELSSVRTVRIETQNHQQATELLRLRREKEIIAKRLQDAERLSGQATKSAANLSEETSVIMRNAEEWEKRADLAEAQMQELKRRLGVMMEDNRKLNEQLDSQKVAVIESEKEKLQAEAKNRELQFQRDADSRKIIQLEYDIKSKANELNQIETLNDNTKKEEALQKELDFVKEELVLSQKQVMIAEEKNTKVQSELRRMDKDIENELKERELIVQELKETTASKKDLEASLEQITKERDELLQETKKHKNMLDHVEDDKLNLEEQSSELDAINRKMRRNIQDLTEEIKDKDVEIEELKFRISSEAGSTTDLKTSIGDLERELKSVNDELKYRSELLEERTSELDTSKDSERRLRMQLEEMDQRVQEFSQTTVENEDRVKSQTSEISRLQTEIKNLKTNLKQTEDQLARQEEENNRLKRIKHEKEIAIDTMEDASREQVQEMRRQIEDRQKDIVGFKSKIASLEEEIEHTEQRRSEQLNKILDLENQKRLFDQFKSQNELALKEKDRKIEGFDEKYRKLDDDNQKFLNQIRELNQTKRSIEKERFDTSLENEEIQRKLREAERKIRDLERKISNQSESDVKLAELQAELDEKVRANRRLTENLDKAQEKVVLVESELRKSQGIVKASETRKGQEARRRDQLELELQAKTEVLNQANDKISELEDILHEKSILMTTLERENQKIRENLDDETIIKDNAENRVEKLQVQLAAADERYKGLATKLEGMSGGKVPDLQPEVDRLTKTIDEKSRQLAQAEARVARIQRELEAQIKMQPGSDAEARRKIAALKKQLEDERHRNDELQDAVRNQEHRNIEGQAKLVEGDHKNFEKELFRMRRALEEKDRKIASAEETILKQKEVIEELDNIQKQSEDAALNEMQGYMTDTRSQFETMRKQLQLKDQEVAKLKNEKEVLESDLDNIEEKYELLEERYENTRKAKNDQGTTIEETASLIRELRDKLLESQSEVTRLKRRLEGTVASKDENEDELADLMAEKENLQTRFDHIASQLATVELENDELKGERDECFVDIEKQKEVIATQEDEIEILKSQVELAQREAEKQANQISHGQIDSKAVKSLADKELQEWKKKCDDLEKRLQDETKELKIIMEQHKKTEQKLRHVLSQAENSSSKNNANNEVLELRLKSMKQQLDISESELDLAQNEKRKFRDECSAKDEELTNLSKQIASLQARLRIAEASKSGQMEITTI